MGNDGKKDFFFGSCICIGKSPDGQRSICRMVQMYDQSRGCHFKRVYRVSHGHQGCSLIHEQVVRAKSIYWEGTLSCCSDCLHKQ